MKSDSKKSLWKQRKKVYLLHKNIKTTKSSKKLNYIKIKPFKVIQDLKNINYRLKLSKNSQIHLIFHVLVLKSAGKTSHSKSIYQTIMWNQRRNMKWKKNWKSKTSTINLSTRLNEKIVHQKIIHGNLKRTYGIDNHYFNRKNPQKNSNWKENRKSTKHLTQRQSIQN